MRNIIAVLWMSLDGVVESPEQWAFTYANDELQEVNERGMAASDVLLLGRVTYQEFAAYWPTSGSIRTRYTVCGVRSAVLLAGLYLLCD